MKVLITGANGFLGRAIVAALKSSPEKFEIWAYAHRELDVTDFDALYLTYREAKYPDVVINCSGITGNSNCKDQPRKTWKVNVEGVANLVKLLSGLAGTLLVQPSSVVVFDGSRAFYREDDQPWPKWDNVYARTKFAAEAVVRSSDIEYLMPRVTTGYGLIHEHDSTNFLKLVVNALGTDGSSRPFFTDQFANPIEINDVALALKLLVEKKYYGIINLGGPNIVSMYEFALAIKKEFGLPGEATMTTTGPGYSRNIRLDTTLARSMGIQAKGLIEGIRSCKPAV